MNDQKADAARRPVDRTSAEKSFENEGGGNQAPAAAPTSSTGKVGQAVRTLRVRFTGPGKAS